MKSDLPQGTLDLLILKVLALEPLHGYAIAQRLEQVSGAVVQIGQGTLYPELHRARGQVLSAHPEGAEGAGARDSELGAAGRSGAADPRPRGRRRAMRRNDDRAIRKEMQSHLDEHAAGLMAQGVAPAEARRWRSGPRRSKRRARTCGPGGGPRICCGTCATDCGCGGGSPDSPRWCC